MNYTCKTIALASAIVAFTITTTSVKAVTYGDATGETISGAGIVDITSVEVNNTATDLIFKINLNGDPTVTDWGKYLISFDTTAGGATTGNGWNRPINMTSGMDYWVGSWADSGNGAELYKYTGSWGLQSATYSANPDALSISKNSSSVTLTFNFAGLGLTTGNSFLFDVYTTGGGGTDGAVDALANPNQSIANWGDTYSTASPFVDSYTIAAVPEPATLTVLGLGSLLAWNRITRRRS